MRSKCLITVIVGSVMLGALAGTGCYKTTGGGWFYDLYTARDDYPGDKVTFGFNARPVSDPVDGVAEAKGQLQLVAHHEDGTETVVHGQFTITGDLNDPDAVWFSIFEGTCKIDGVGPEVLSVAVIDNGDGKFKAGDTISVTAGAHYWDGFLGGGNIKIHSKK